MKNKFKFIFYRNPQSGIFDKKWYDERNIKAMKNQFPEIIEKEGEELVFADAINDKVNNTIFELPYPIMTDVTIQFSTLLLSYKTNDSELVLSKEEIGFLRDNMDKICSFEVNDVSVENKDYLTVAFY